MKEYINEELKNMIASFQQLPYLFVGTGLSMRYANAPSWDGLLFDIWKIVNPDKKDRDYKKIKQGIERKVDREHDDLVLEEKKYYVNPILASKIEEQFCSAYYDSFEFENKNFTDKENEEIIEHNYNPFKYFVAQKLKEVELKPEKDDYRELECLIKNQNKLAGIITTNYDTVLENIFTEFSTLIGQDSLLVASTLNIFEMFKIHGCCTDPNSIVLTEEDYENFDKKLKYLSAKLLTIFVEHPIIFIGYGLGDINIRKLLREIAECLTSKQLEKIKNNFIFISPAFGAEEEYRKNKIEFGNNFIEINEFSLNDYSLVYDALSEIKSSMPIKLARKLQDMVCKYVYSAEATNTILFGDIDSPDIDDEKVAIFIGQSDMVTNIGFSYFNIDEILEDILLDNKPYLVNPQLIEKTFKAIRARSGATILPIYKYIDKLKYPLEKIPDNYNIIKTYKDCEPSESEKKSYLKDKIEFGCIADIEIAYPNHIPKQVAHIKKFAEAIPIDDFEIYIKKYFGTEEFKKHISHFRKLIAIYDFKKYFLHE